MALLWFSPCWLFQASPVPFDFIAGEEPWKHLVPTGYLTKNLLLNDVPLQFMPWREAVRDAVLAGELPTLNRLSESGAALWENHQSAVLYPLTLAGILFSSFSFPLFSATAKVLVSLCGTWLLIRRMGGSFAAGLLAAIAYTFGAFTIAWLMFPATSVTALLPLLLYFLHRASVIGGSLVLGAMLLGGHPESVLHSALVAVPYAVRLATTRAHVAKFAAIALLGFAIAAPVLLPFLSYLPFSQRIADIEEHPGFLRTPPFEIDSFIPFIIPNYFGNPRVHNYRHPINFNDLCTQYVGLAALALALAAMVAQPRRNLLEIAILLVAVLLAIAPAPVERLLNAIPILNISAHAKLRFVIALMLAILGARGLDLLLKGGFRKIFAVIAATLFIGVSTIALLSYPVFAQIGIRRLIFFTEIFALAGTAVVALLALWRRTLPPLLVPGLVFLDLATVMGLYNPAVSKRFYYPSTPAIDQLRQGNGPGRVIALGHALMPNASVLHGVEDIRVHDPLSFRPYVKLLEQAGLDRTTYFAQFRKLPPGVLLDYLGVRGVLSEDGRVDLRTTALPRYFIPDSVVSSAEPVRDFLASNEPLNVFVNGAATPVSPALVQLREYARTRTALDIVSERETFVATSEVALPGWRLRNNGRPWPLVVVNGTFLGWRVPAGGGRFELSYRPRFLTHGTVLSISALAILIALARRSRKTKDPARGRVFETSSEP